MPPMGWLGPRARVGSSPTIGSLEYRRGEEIMKGMGKDGEEAGADIREKIATNMGLCIEACVVLTPWLAGAFLWMPTCVGSPNLFGGCAPRPRLTYL